MINRFSGNFRPREQRNLPFQFRRNDIRQSFAVCNQYSACHFIMFRLRKHIRRYHFRVTGIICQNQNFTGACNHVNGNPAKNLFFGFCHKSIAGAYDLIHTGHTFCPIRQRANGLCTTDFCRRQNHRIDLALFCRSRHNDFPYPCDFCRNGIHQNRRGIACRTAGYIDTSSVQRNDLLSQHHTVFFCNDKVRTFLFFMESPNVCRRFFQNGNEFRVYRRHSRHTFFRCHFQHIQLGTIKAFTVTPQGFVAIFPHICQNFCYGICHICFFFCSMKNIVYGNFCITILLDHGYHLILLPAEALLFFHTSPVPVGS